MNKTKTCPSCGETKPLEGGFYKSTKWWTKRCRPCHNKYRARYKKQKTAYKPKPPRPKGIMRQPEDLRTRLADLLRHDYSVKQAWRVLLNDYPDLKYQSMLRWRRLGQIPV